MTGDFPTWAAVAAVGGAAVGVVISRMRAGDLLKKIPVPTFQVRSIIAHELQGSTIPVWFGMTNAALESGFDEGASLVRGRDDSHGLMMINLRVDADRDGDSDFAEILAREGLSPGDLYDPAVNVRFWRDHIAGVFARGGRSRGLSGDPLWQAVRCRLAGIGWGDMDGATATKIKARFWAYAARFR